MIGTPSLFGHSLFKRENDFQEFTFLLLKRRWIQKLVFEDGGVQNISRIKIYLATIILIILIYRSFYVVFDKSFHWAFHYVAY